MPGESRVLKTDQEDAVRAILVDACLEMLVTCGVRADLIAAGAPVAYAENHIASFIGFTGSVRGSLVIAASSSVFDETYPRVPRSALPLSPADRLDWAGEIANQILGRMKRRFCERGVDFDVSSPAAVNGRHIAGRSEEKQGVFELAFDVGNGTVTVCLDIVVPEDGIIFSPRAEPIACSAEGELWL